MSQNIDEQTRIEMEAAAWRKLVSHFQKRTDVQNIDLMNMAGFCRNCMSKWYKGAAEEKGLEMDYEEAREIIYGMPYNEWKDQYQGKATEEQLNKFNAITKDQITE
jgi:hypothetical protein